MEEHSKGKIMKFILCIVVEKGGISDNKIIKYIFNIFFTTSSKHLE